MARKAGFLTPLRLEKKGERLWLVFEPLDFYSAEFSRTFRVPAGTRTDLASVPRGLWNIFPKTGNQDCASVVHDGGYSGCLTDTLGNKLLVDKKTADKLFREGMLAMGVSPRKAWLMWKGVSIFGRTHVGSQTT